MATAPHGTHGTCWSWEPACTHLQLAVLGQQQLVYAAELTQELFVGCAW